MEPLKKYIDLIGFPMDLGADRRGVDMGPSAIRIAGMVEELEVLGYHVQDLGDISILSKERQKIINPKLKYLDEIVRTSCLLAEKVEQSLQQGHFPLCIGGDHAMAIGSIAGVSAFCRSIHRTFGVIWIDAHTDMNTEETTPSGNIHGMAMAVSLGLGNNPLTHILGFAPKVQPSCCALIGIRKIDPLEKEIVKTLQLPVHTMSDIDRKGAHTTIRNILQTLSHVDHIHVSFDLDSVDPSVAAGVGTPVAGGLTYREVHLIMETIAECGCMASLDIAEVNPILDNRNTSARLATELVASSMGRRIL
ncbi:MAG: arginase [Deltaproteobacteria bacterium]|nr:arginase [Deltaproteobacteria bacterium]